MFQQSCLQLKISPAETERTHYQTSSFYILELKTELWSELLHTLLQLAISLKAKAANTKLKSEKYQKPCSPL